MIGLQYVFDSKIKPTVKVGDNVTVEGVKDEHNGIEQIIKYTVKTNSGGNAVTYSEPTEITAANIAGYNTNLGYVKHFTRLLSGNSIHEEVLHERLWSSSGRHTILLVVSSLEIILFTSSREKEKRDYQIFYSLSFFIVDFPIA